MYVLSECQYSIYMTFAKSYNILVIIPSPLPKHEFHLNFIAALMIAAQYTANTTQAVGVDELQAAIRQYTTSPQFALVKKAIKSLIKSPRFELFIREGDSSELDSLVEDLTKICVENKLAKMIKPGFAVLNEANLME
ncbi:hypothetical protein FRC02_002222 [Tulasnella sp. 418]|nr:hypothetical protein FRC02_002222 [Tulasnella sp. 418]